MTAPKHGSEQYVKHFFTDETVAARPTSWEVALHAGNPGTGDANEVTDSAYARQSVTFVSSDEGSFFQAQSEADVVYAAASASASYTVTHFTVRNAGNDEALMIVALQTPIPVVENGIVSFPAGFIKVRGV